MLAVEFNHVGYFVNTSYTFLEALLRMSGTYYLPPATLLSVTTDFGDL